MNIFKGLFNVKTALKFSSYSVVNIRLLQLIFLGKIIAFFPKLSTTHKCLVVKRQKVCHIVMYSILDIVISRHSSLFIYGS